MRFVAVALALLLADACSSSGSHADAKSFAETLCGDMRDWGQTVNGAGLEAIQALKYSGTTTSERAIQAWALDKAASATTALVQSIGALGRSQPNGTAEARLAGALHDQFTTIAARLNDIHQRWLALPVTTEAQYQQGKAPLQQEYLQASKVPPPLSLLGPSKPAGSDSSLVAAFRSSPQCAGMV